MESSTITELHLQKPSASVRVFFVENLGSLTLPDFRLVLRKHLFRLLVKENLAPPDSLLNLGERATHPTLHISLSHAERHSVIAWSDKSLRVGVDIEDLGRVSEKVVKRVSNAQELANAPHPSYIWSAKEAALKALFPVPKLLSSVEIIDWSPLEHEHWSYGVGLKNTPVGYGELCLKLNHSLALFTLPS